MATDMNKLNESCSWKDLTEGMQIYEGGTSAKFHTGEWTAVKPDVHSACFAYLSVPTAQSRFPITKEEILIITTAKAAASA